MTNEELAGLKMGDVIQSTCTHGLYLVAVNYGDHAVGINVAHISHANEWDLLLTATHTPPPASYVPLTLSDGGLQLLKELEGMKLQPYADISGYLTIGIGHLLTKDELSSGKLRLGSTAHPWRQGLTELLAAVLLHQDLQGIMVPVQPLLLDLPIPLTQRQQDALVCLIFNIGPTAFRNSTLLKRLQAGDLADVPTQWRRWVYSGGKRRKGLKNRRERELALWQGDTL